MCADLPCVLAWLERADWARVIEVAAIAAAAAAAIAGWLVARSAKSIASDARDAEKAQAVIAMDALRASRRQGLLAMVPNLTAASPMFSNVEGPRFFLQISNAGPTVAYGILLSVAHAASRSLDDVEESTRTSSRREPSLVPHGRALILDADAASLGDGWMEARLECYSPFGTLVRHHYLFTRDQRKWRLHRVTIDPRDGGAELVFDLALGPEGEDAQPPPFSLIG